jgi:D-beta-D-heptose 7-phosphate kinase / D-beta-D-heptose 1-phosphate adenosyltransferase
MSADMQNILSNLAAFDRCRIAVIGDLMLDEYLWGHIERISPEAPVPILNVVRRESMLGGAGNVVKNLRSLGVNVSVLGVVGPDETGEEVRELLCELGLETSGVIRDTDRKSTRKVRLMSLEHGQQVFRFDEESAERITAVVEDHLIDLIREQAVGTQVILCSDYRKGVLTERVLDSIYSTSREGHIVSLVAPKDSNSNRYRGASILMPNVKELSQLVGMPSDGSGWLNASAVDLTAKLGLEALLVTRGSQGMSLFEHVESGLRRVDIPTMARSVYDVTGAGDTAIAVFATGIASGADRETAAHLANLAAGIKVGKRGTASVTVPEIQERLRDLRWPVTESEGIASACGAS